MWGISIEDMAKRGVTESNRGRVSGAVSRRRLLQQSGLIGTGILGGIAGCVNQSDDGSDGSDGDDTDGSNDDSGSDSITIVTNETNEGAREWFNQMAQDFEEETGTAVEMDFTSLTPEERITTLIQTGNTPELATLDLRLASTFVLNDQLVDIGDQISAFEDAYQGTIPENYQLQLDGGNWYLPLWINPTQIWYWADVYNEYGFDQQAALSWDEYLEIVREVDSGDMTGTIIPSASTGQSSLLYWGFLLSNGGQVLGRRNGEVQVVLDSDGIKDRAVETAEYLNELHQYSPRASDYNWGENINSFVARSGASAMYPPRIKLAAIENSGQPSSNVKPHYPIENGSKRMISFPGGLAMFKEASNLSGAREYLNFIAQENRLIDLLTSVAPVHNWPAVPEITETDEYQNDEFISQHFTDDELAVIRDSFQNGITFGGETEPFNRFGAALFGTNELGTLLFNVNIEDKDPETAVEDTAQRLREELSDLK